MRIAWYFDYISPFAYLHWPKVKRLMEERHVEPVPILFAAILNAHGQKGPAEIPGKREFTYRHVLWQARREGLPLRMPPSHPFNPIPALRLSIAAGNTPEVIDAICDWIWGQGQAGDSTEALQPVIQRLAVAPEALDSDTVKRRLRANTDAALAAGVFGVPTLAIGDTLFWGNDVHDFALQALADPGLLQDPEMQRIERLPVGVRRI